MAFGIEEMQIESMAHYIVREDVMRNTQVVDG